jgi:hypothetical protein
MFDYGPEQKRRDGEVESRSAGAPERIMQRRKCFFIRVFALHVAEKPIERFNGRRIYAATVLIDAGARPFFELVEREIVARHADDGNIQGLAPNHGMQGGKDLFIGKIARDAKEYQRVRMSSHPGAPCYVSADFSM